MRNSCPKRACGFGCHQTLHASSARSKPRLAGSGFIFLRPPDFFQGQGQHLFYGRRPLRMHHPVQGVHGRGMLKGLHTHRRGGADQSGGASPASDPFQGMGRRATDHKKKGLRTIRIAALDYPPGKGSTHDSALVPASALANRTRPDAPRPASPPCPVSFWTNRAPIKRPAPGRSSLLPRAASRIIRYLNNKYPSKTGVPRHNRRRTRALYPRFGKGSSRLFSPIFPSYPVAVDRARSSAGMRTPNKTSQFNNEAAADVR